MEKIIQNIQDSFNLKKQAEELGLEVWKTPSFLFIMMGIVIIGVMTGVYFVSRRYDDPVVLIMSETLVVIMLLTIGNSIIMDIEQMARTNKTRSEFVSIASHQLKTPLSEIGWEAELLITKNSQGLNEKQLGLIKNIISSNDQMKKLVNDLLDVSRIEQGKLSLLKEKFDLGKVVQDVVGESRILALAKGINFKLKPIDSSLEIFGDRRRIKVVIANLVSNAINYTGHNGKVELGIDREEKEATFWIRDNGIGIPKSQYRNIFQKFFRVDNAMRYQTSGTGLGLYISKNIIEQAGGKIWFSSVEGVGTEFFFSLPLINKV